MNLLERLLKRRSENRAKSLEQEKREGAQALELLRDGLFTQIVTEMRENIIDNWTQSPLRDIEGREHMRMMIEVLDKIVKRIEHAYLTGELASKKIEEDQKKSKRKR